MVRKVAIILNDLNVVGGVQITTIAMAKALADDGYKIDIVSFNIDYKAISILFEGVKLKNKDVNIKLLKFPRFSISRSIIPVVSSTLIHDMKDYFLVINANGDMQLMPADIVYFHQFNVDYNFRGGNLLRRIIYTPPWFFRKIFLEELKSRGSLVLVNSFWTLTEARVFWGFSNIKVLHPPLINYEDLRRCVNKPRTQDIALTLSRFSPDRGLDRIVSISKDIPWAKFIIAGYIHDKKYFREIYLKKPRNLQLYPNVSEEQKLHLLSKAKVYINPTPYVEGFGMAVAEGMAAGLIPVTSDKGGVRDFVPERYRFKDMTQLSKVVEESLKQWDLKLATALSERASTLSFENFKKKLMCIISDFK